MYTETSRTSFEFYPPRKGEALVSFLGSVRAISRLDPALITMTFGAGGSSLGETPELLAAMASVTDVRLASHLTYLRQTKEELTGYIDRMEAMSVRHIIALRGDFPDTLPPRAPGDYFETTAEFVAYIKARGFDVSVAAYPEGHPESPDAETDMAHFKDKCDAGADRAFTQLFFDNMAFYDFRERAAKAGVSRPIVPGLVPIKNFEGMVRFAGKLKAQMPETLCDKFNRAAKTDHPMIAAEALILQIENLKRNGVDNFHFYTLNKVDALEIVCRATGLVPPMQYRQM